jgi:hypothetical protein
MVSPVAALVGRVVEPVRVGELGASLDAGVFEQAIAAINVRLIATRFIGFLRPA